MEVFDGIISLFFTLVTALVAFAAYRYFVFRRSIHVHAEKLKSTYERRKRTLDEFIESMRTRWETQRGEFSQFVSKIGSRTKSKSEAVLGFNPTSRTEAIVLPLDVALMASQLVSNQVTLAGDFKDAAERFLHTEFDSSASLAENLQDRLAPEWHSQIFGPNSEILEGWINGIKGHMGEGEVLEMLRAEGLTVELPESGSQAGYDLLLGDAEFQVKTVESYASVSQHIRNYPEIPAIFNSDAAFIPEGVPTMSADELADLIESGNFDLPAVALEGFELADAAEAASDGMDAALGSADIGVPIATIALSSVREFKTWKEGHTNATSAVLNVGIDAGARSLGLTAGAKAGALVGSMMAPGIGTVVGGVVGGLVGGFLGGRGAKAFRESDANSAHEQFAREHQRTQAEMVTVFEGPKRAFEQIETSLRTELVRVSDAARQSVDRFEQQVTQQAKDLASALQGNFLRALENQTRRFSNLGVLAWFWSPERAAALHARKRFLISHPKNELAVVLTDDEIFPSSMATLATFELRLSKAAQVLSISLLESQRKAASVSHRHAEMLASDFQPSQLQALATSIDALETLAPLLSQAVEEAQKASLHARAAALNEFHQKMNTEVTRLKSHKDVLEKQLSRSLSVRTAKAS